MIVWASAVAVTLVVVGAVGTWRDRRPSDMDRLRMSCERRQQRLDRETARQNGILEEYRKWR